MTEVPLPRDPLRSAPDLNICERKSLGVLRRQAQNMDVIQPSRGTSEGGYYHDVLRVAKADRVEDAGTGRSCITCGKGLSRYNRREQCYGCQ